MKATRFRTNRISILFLLSATACAPVAPSVSKSTIQKPADKPAATDTQVVKPYLALSVEIIRKRGVSPASKTYKDSFDVSSEQLGRIGEKLFAEVEFPRGYGPAEKGLRAYVNLSAGSVDIADLNRFKPVLQQMDSKTWRLTVSDKTPSDVAKQILSRISSATIAVDQETQDSIQN